MPRGLIRVDGDVAYVTLTRGHVATIDAADVETVLPFSWYAHVREHLVYAIAQTKNTAGKQQALYMHTLILQPPRGRITDHIDGNGLNNRRDNLRAATHGENKYNSRVYKNSQSGTKGVMPTKQGTWTAQIRHERRKHYLGTFKTQEEAKRAYEEAAASLHGDYACTGLRA